MKFGEVLKLGGEDDLGVLSKEELKAFADTNNMLATGDSMDGKRIDWKKAKKNSIVNIDRIIHSMDETLKK